MKKDYKKISTEEALIEGLTEALDVLNAGERLEDRFTMRTVDLNLAPQPYKAKDVKAIRETLNVSQSIFAQLLAVKVKTIQSWEQGLTPSPMACRLMDLIAADPQKWRDTLKSSLREKTTA